MSQQVRFLVFVGISIGLLALWQTFFAPPPKPRVKAPAQVAQQTEKAPSAPAAVEPAPAPTPPAAEAATPEPEVRTVAVTTDLWRATFTTKGAGLVSFELLGRKQETRGRGDDRHPTDLVRLGEGQPTPLALELSTPGFGADAVWEVAEQTPTKLVFRRTKGDVTVLKTFTFEQGSYALGLVADVRKEGGLAKDGVATKLHFATYETPVASSGGFLGMGGTKEIHQAVCRVDGKVKRHVHDADAKTVAIAGKPDFAGVDFKYFIAAMAPAGDAPATCELGSDRAGALSALLARPAVPGADGAAKLSYELFLGPKDVERLEAFGHGLVSSIDYGYFGFFDVIARPLLAVLRVLERISGNWGVAIILLTLLVKLVTFPLTHKQMKSMEEMRRLTPKMEEIKTRFAGDQQKINLETMKLYKDHNVQPLAGCLPMLIQMPVWFALYSMLSTSFELYNEPFIQGWISDLTSKDPFFVTPVLMTVTMVLTQILTPQANTQPQMKYMMYAMPVFFGFIMLSLPAGLVLYIFTNNLLSIAQSLWFRKVHGPGATPAAA